ncbi:MAG: tRNA ((37)-N6)-threonylcarbamoyltransferase complex dimerization subunit type 1 TsaB, partial [Bacteroidota bacterium]
MTKAKILHIETATTVCSVALAENGELRVLKSVNDGFKHAENLMRLIREAMQEMNWQYSELAAIAVSAGPGSYTGLRIGVSAAKGLCYGTGAPLIAVSTLYTLAAGFRRLFPEADTLICPMIDARRMEVYTAVFNRDLHNIRP